MSNIHWAFTVGTPGRSILDRFNDNYCPEPNTGCWLWTGTLHRYGVLSINGHTTSAHRLSWRIFKGEIPEDYYVCHKCDTPSCVNPEHLFVGTSADNTKDMIEKGRDKFGLKKLNTKCKYGHLLIGDNVYWRPDRPGSRECVTCAKARRDAWWEKNGKKRSKQPK